MANYIKFRVRPVLNYYGGKGWMARRIIELIPDSEVFVEPFAGGLSVLLNKCKYGREIVGDLNPGLIHLYETLRDHAGILIDRLRAIPYSREVFTKALSAGVVEDPIERALNFLIKYRMSFGGMGRKFGNDSTQCKNGHRWYSLPDGLKFTAHRLQGVRFRVGSALDLIDEYDGPETSLYLDPPYYASTRQFPNEYEHEMTAFEHLILLKRIRRFRGHVVISGYDNPVYNRELKDWERYEFGTPSFSSINKAKRTEVIWVKSESQHEHRRSDREQFYLPPSQKRSGESVREYSGNGQACGHQPDRVVPGV